MSDLIDGNEGDGEGKHGQARALAEAALRARDAGDNDRADLLLEEARRIDPSAVEDLLMELGPHELTQNDPALEDGTASDEEVALITRTIQPHSDAPSRSGITGSGSGADSQ
jgi:hypothetical protein